MLNRILETKPQSFDDAAGALGEIRALGVLNSIGAYPMPLKASSMPGASTPDFEVNRKTWKNAGEVTVEAYTRRMDADERQKLVDFSRGSGTTTPQKPVSVRECCVAPFGAADKGENGYLNVAHKIASAKQGSLQAKDNVPHVLWIDLQDAEASVIDEAFMLPLWSGPGCVAFSTGPVWQGLYGMKGDPVLQAHFAGSTTPIAQSFPGKFAQDQKVSMVVCSMPTHVAAFENPAAKNPVPGWFLFSLMCCPCFSWPHSFVGWPNSSKDLEQRVLAARNTIQAIADFEPT